MRVGLQHRPGWWRVGSARRAAAPTRSSATRSTWPRASSTPGSPGKIWRAREPPTARPRYAFDFEAGRAADGRRAKSKPAVAYEVARPQDRARAAVWWRSLFYFNVPFGLIIIVLVFWQLKGEWAEAKGERVDLPGSFLYALTLLLIMVGLSLLPAGSGIGLIGAGAIGVTSFLLLEVRTKSPILNVKVFKHNPVFAFSNLAAFIHYSSTFAVTFLMSLYLQYIKGLSAQGAGVILISQPLMMAAFSPLAGRLSDRIEPRVIASLGMACTCLAIYLLSFLVETTGLPYIIFALLLLGFGFALFSSPNTNAVMSSVEKRYYGVASGTIGTMRLIGQMFSMGMALMIFSILIGKVSITPVLFPLFLKSVKIALIINGTLCFIGIFLSLARGKIQRQV